VNEARYRKERDRERTPKKDESRERVGRSRCKEDIRKDKKGNDQRKMQGRPERNGQHVNTEEPKSKKKKSESKLEELDDDDLLQLRKELLKQMKAEDLEKLEAANENVEDGEISDSNDDEVTDSKQSQKASFDLRAKLKRKSSDPKESAANKNKNKDTGSDKENSTQKEAKSRGAQRPLSKRTSQDENEVVQDKVATRKGSKYGVERNHTDDQEVNDAGRERKGDNKTKDKNTEAKEDDGEEGMRPELLLGFSTEDIDHKLIPFKKRQFKQLQFEEIQLKAQIAARSASSTPVRSVSESSTEEKKVSPIKLSLKDVVIEPPSSSSDLPTSASSSSDHLGGTSLLDSLPTPAAPAVPLPPNTDDNATFPQTLDNSLVFSDLQMTDESEAELSPVKRRSKAALHKDITSPQAISSLLRKPLVATSLLPKARGEKREKSESPVKRRKKKFGRSTTQLSS